METNIKQNIIAIFWKAVVTKKNPYHIYVIDGYQSCYDRNLRYKQAKTKLLVRKCTQEENARINNQIRMVFYTYNDWDILIEDEKTILAGHDYPEYFNSLNKLKLEYLLSDVEIINHRRLIGLDKPIIKQTEQLSLFT